MIAPTVHDNERVAYLKRLAKRTDRIELVELSKLIEHLVHDDNRVTAVRAFSEKISPDFSADDYRKLISQIVVADNKQKVEISINGK
jgi:hypothetical protein